MILITQLDNKIELQSIEDIVYNEQECILYYNDITIGMYYNKNIMFNELYVIEQYIKRNKNYNMNKVYSPYISNNIELMNDVFDRLYNIR